VFIVEQVLSCAMQLWIRCKVVVNYQ